MRISREAFLNKSGAALIKKYSHLEEELFTGLGYKKYAEDLLRRMTNPFLADTVERAGRDPLGKLGLDDRIFGTMTLALEQGIEPTNMALGALAGIGVLLQRAEENNLPADLCFDSWPNLDDVEITKIIHWLWRGQSNKFSEQLIKYVQNARKKITIVLDNE